MGNLIAFGFDHSWAANEVLQKVQSETILDEAFVVERAASGRCVIRRSYGGSAREAGNSSGEKLWGEMVRLLFLNSGLDAAIPRGGSALFLLVKDAAGKGALKAVKPYGARVLKTSASGDAENRLKSGFTKAA